MILFSIHDGVPNQTRVQFPYPLMFTLVSHWNRVPQILGMKTASFLVLLWHFVAAPLCSVAIRVV